MIKIFVDSGSSIKQDKREQFGVEVLPLRILLGGVEYDDGVNLTNEEFYRALIEGGEFPKTSLPSIDEVDERVARELKNGNEVLILTLSSGISGTYSALSKHFEGEPRVRVVDSQSAVGGMQILVSEANKYLDRGLDFVEQRLKELAPRIKILAVPKTLEYLHRGGRLSRASWAIGTVLHIKPIIMLKNTVQVAGKAIGIRRAQKFIVAALTEADLSYPIVPEYTYSTVNLDALIEMTPPKYRAIMTESDDISLAIASHWGPESFGFAYVVKE